MTAMSRMRRPRWLVFFALGLLAAIAGGVRLAQVEIVRPAAEIEFSELHSMEWDPAHGTLTPTGDDPHGFMAIPAASLPLTGVVMEFSGGLPPGPSYIYPSPAHIPRVDITDAITGQVEPVGGGFRLRFVLPPCRLARFDLPDQLHSAFVLRKVTFQTHFVGSSNVVFSLFVGFSGAALLFLGWTLLGPGVTRHRGFEIAGLALLVAAKLWLAGGLQQTIFAYAAHDDALFLSQGHSIAGGQWLGPFGELTLSKGPTFQIFIALVQLTRIPFLEAEAGFHALACLVFLLALAPLIPSVGARLALFGVLLFDPHTLSIQVVAQVLRSGIQPALTLFALAGFIGLAVRAAGRPARLIPWAALAGGAFSLFWFCREEGVWLAPSVALLTVAGLWLAWRAGANGRLARLALLVSPLLIFLGAQGTLRAVNLHYYGAPITIDVKDGAYPAAYAALTRIIPQQNIPGVPVTKESRLRAYAVSPAFAELQPMLEGELGNRWAEFGWENSRAPSAKKEIRGWFQWALREAARNAGHYRNAATATAYWQRVADEINAACDHGRLQGGPRRSGFTPRWDASLWPVFGRSLLGAADVVLQFVDFNPQSTPSGGDPDQIAFYGRMIHEPAVLTHTPPTPRTHLGIIDFHLYAAAGALASLLALAGLLALAVHAVRHRASLAEIAILLALLGGTLALMVLMALVDATSFSTVHAIYLAPATPLALATWVLAPVWALRIWQPALPTSSVVWTRLPEFARWLRTHLPALLGLAALAALALGASFATIRRREMTTVIPGNAVAFSMVNDMKWDASSRQLTRTGTDPFGSLDLPETALPVRDISIDFMGEFADVQGHFYAFQYAASLPGWGTDGNTMTEGQVTRHGGEFNVHWVLQDTKVVRIDLPDFLDHPIEVKELRLKTTFAWTGSAHYRAMLYAFGFAALLAGAAATAYMFRRLRKKSALE